MDIKKIRYGVFLAQLFCAGYWTISYFFGSYSLQFFPIKNNLGLKFFPNAILFFLRFLLNHHQISFKHYKKKESYIVQDTYTCMLICSSVYLTILLWSKFPCWCKLSNKFVYSYAVYNVQYLPNACKSFYFYIFFKLLIISCRFECML